MLTPIVPPTTIRNDVASRKAIDDPPSTIAMPTRMNPLAIPITIAVSKPDRMPTCGSDIGASAVAAETLGGGAIGSAPIRFDDLGHRHAEAVVDHDHFSTRDEPVVYVDVDGLADLAVELDHRPAAQLQELADLHRRLSEHCRHLNGNV